MNKIYVTCEKKNFFVNLLKIAAGIITIGISAKHISDTLNKTIVIHIEETDAKTE